MARNVDVAERRELILNTAVRVFAQQGFTATRIEDIAREAGVAKGTIYLYFTSKEALLAAVFEAYAARSQAVVASLGDGPALARLEQLLRSVVAMLVSTPDHARVVLDMHGMGLPFDLPAVYRAYRDQVAELIGDARREGTLRAGIDERHAAVIVGAVEGCLVQWLADPQVPLQDLATPIIQICVEGIHA